jgi:alkylation response protein AidB-like acyl-CoA dehydrogenase
VEPLPGGGEAACRVRDVGLVLLAADAFGGASRLVEMSVEYAKTRVQFDVPIGQFQAVKHKLADMATDVEPARGLYWYAAHAIDRLPAESERAAALAKAHLTDRYLQVAREAVEVHGGIGFTWECDVQIWFKRAMFDRAYLGPPEGHRDRAAALAGW